MHYFTNATLFLTFIFVLAYKTEKETLEQLVDYMKNHDLKSLRNAPPDLEMEMEVPEELSVTRRTRAQPPPDQRDPDDIRADNARIAIRNKKKEFDQYELFAFFIRLCLPCVGPKKSWDDKHRVRLLSRFVTNTEEAFAILMFENNIDTFMALGLKRETRMTAIKEYLVDNNITPKYTTARGRDVGWSEEGMDRFEVLMSAVGVARIRDNNPEYRDMDVKFLEDSEQGSGSRGSVRIVLEGQRVTKKRKTRFSEL